MRSFNGLFNGKSRPVWNLSFMKSLPYSPSLPQFIDSISCLIPSYSSVYSLIFPSFHLQNQKLNIYSRFFFLFFFFNISIYLTNGQIKMIFTVNILIIIKFFNCDVSNVVNTNAFLRPLSIFSKFESKTSILIMSSKK